MFIFWQIFPWWNQKGLQEKQPVGVLAVEINFKKFKKTK